MRKINKIAILGGGLTGLTAAYYLNKKKYQVVLYEKEDELGGLAKGFKNDNWNWSLERTIHHIFANDNDILDFAKEIQFDEFFFQSPETASLYKIPISNSQFPNQPQASNFKLQSYPLDTPLDLLKFPLLSFTDRVRSGMVMAFIKFFPLFSFYEKYTAQEFLEKFMGKKAYKILFGELFRKKFGKYAENILASFIWARIKKRTKSLGYIKGGFQHLVDYIENQLISSRVKILKNYEIKEINKKNNQYIIDGEKYDGIISTLPTPVLIKTSNQIFDKNYINRLSQIKFLNSISLVIESEKPIFDKTYWMNILATDIPIMGLFQQTNFVDKKNYGGKNILYCGWYAAGDDKLWSMSDKQIVDYAWPYLNEILNFELRISNFRVFRAAYAQPIFDKEFLKNKPKFITPEENFFIANLDMTYPYDRGTNFAVKLGKQVADLL